MKFYPTTLLIICLTCLACSGGGLSLVDIQTSEFRIVIAENASPAEEHAAHELQFFIKEITGAGLPIDRDAGELFAHEILVGRSRHVDQLNLNIDWPALGEEGFVMRSTDRHLILAGTGKRGSLYAVYEFLEENLGCRWFAPNVSRIPKMTRIQLPALNRQVVPAFEYRAVGWSSAADPDWAARNRVNVNSPLAARHGGNIVSRGGGHSFFALLPPDKYFKDHPEYYAEIQGRRTHQKTQLCLTNPDVLRLVAQGVKSWLRETPEAQLVAVGQEDWGGWCECAHCQAIVDHEGSQAGVLIHFLNQLGEILEPEFPKVNIITLAYQHTRKPPLHIRPRRNVIPWVCGIECCFSHPIESCELNRAFVADLAGWARLTDRFYLWDYTANFEHYIMPQPNLRVFQPNFQLCVKNNVRGVYASGNTGKGSELAELRSYLLAKLLWNPAADADKIRREFLAGYFGQAVGPIDQYLSLLHDTVEQENIHCFINTGPRAPHLRPEKIARARELFDEAERLAENTEILERVKIARMPIQHVELEWAKPKYRFVGDSYEAEPAPETEQLAREFADVARRNDIPMLCEFENRTPAWHLEQQTFWKKTWPAVHLKNEHLEVSIVPGLGGRVVRLFHVGAQRELLLGPQPDGREYPFSAGIEEYSQRGGREAGWQQAYEYQVEIPGKKLSLGADLPNGLKLHRTITLAENSAELVIHSTLENIADTPKMSCLRIHPIFQLGQTQEIKVVYKTVAGADCTVVLNLKPGQNRGKMLLEKTDRPAGTWTAINAAVGLGITQQFDIHEVEQLWLDWLPERERFFLELASPEKNLAPGEKISLTHRYSVVKE